MTPDEEIHARATALYEEGVAALRRGDSAESARLHDEAIELAKPTRAHVLLARLIAGRSRPAFRDGDHALVQRLNTRALEHARTAGDEDAETLPRHLMAESLRAQERYLEAIPLYQRAIERHTGAGREDEATRERYNLGMVMVCAGRQEEGEALLLQALAEARAADDRVLVAFSTSGLGILAGLQGEAARAGRLLGWVDATFAADGTVLDPAEQLERARGELAARTADEAAYEKAYAEGLVLPADEVLGR